MDSGPKQKNVSSMFIDESGSKNSAGGFFVVGFIKTSKPGLLWREVRDIRQHNHYYEEIKFSSINGQNKRFYFDIVEEIAETRLISRLGASVYDASTGFAASEASWKEQAKMARRIIVGNLNKGENMICFLDLVQTPRGESVADTVKREANRRLEGAPVLEAYDVDSAAHDLVQLADVVAGAIHYLRATPVPNKKKSATRLVAERLCRALELDSFDDTQTGKVNILTMNN